MRRVEDITEARGARVSRACVEPQRDDPCPERSAAESAHRPQGTELYRRRSRSALGGQDRMFTLVAECSSSLRACPEMLAPTRAPNRTSPAGQEILHQQPARAGHARGVRRTMFCWCRAPHGQSRASRPLDAPVEKLRHNCRQGMDHHINRPQFYGRPKLFPVMKVKNVDSKPPNHNSARQCHPTSQECKSGFWPNYRPSGESHPNKSPMEQCATGALRFMPPGPAPNGGE